MLGQLPACFLTDWVGYPNSRLQRVLTSQHAPSNGYSYQGKSRLRKDLGLKLRSMHANVTLRIKCTRLAPKVWAPPKRRPPAPTIHNIVCKLDANLVAGRKSTILDHSLKSVLYRIGVSEAWIPRSLASFKYKAFLLFLEVVTARTSLLSSQPMNFCGQPDRGFVWWQGWTDNTANGGT